MRRPPRSWLWGGLPAPPHQGLCRRVLQENGFHHRAADDEEEGKADQCVWADRRRFFVDQHVRLPYEAVVSNRFYQVGTFVLLFSRRALILPCDSAFASRLVVGVLP